MRCLNFTSSSWHHLPRFCRAVISVHQRCWEEQVFYNLLSVWTTHHQIYLKPTGIKPATHLEWITLCILIFSFFFSFAPSFSLSSSISFVCTQLALWEICNTKSEQLRGTKTLSSLTVNLFQIQLCSTYRLWPLFANHLHSSPVPVSFSSILDSLERKHY